MPTAPAPSEAAATPLHVAVRTLDAAALAAAGHTAASAVAAVYAHAVMRGAASFWLDSALPDPAEARWSVAGDGLDVLGEEQGRVPSPGPRLVRHDDPADPDRAWADLGAAAAPSIVVPPITDDVDAALAAARELALEGIVVTMFDARTLHSREVLERVVDAFGDDVLETVIGRTVKFPDASVSGVPITTFAPEHAAAQAYLRLARELVARGAVA